MSNELRDTESLPYSAAKQEAVLGHLITDAAFFAQASTKVKQSWWRFGRLAQIWKFLEAFFLEHQRHPKSAAELKDFSLWVRQSAEDIKSANETVDRCVARTSDYSLDVLRAELDVWMQANIIESSMTRVQMSYNRVIKTGSLTDMGVVRDSLRTMLRDLSEASFVGNGAADMSDLGQSLKDEYAHYDTALAFGCPAVDDLLLPDGPQGRSLVRGDHTVVLAPTGQGKCLHPDTPVMMHDGTVRPAKAVRAGDALMGPDGLPRNVLSTTTGVGPLYKITPNRGGDSWICNDVHVLSLKCSFDSEPKTRKRKRYAQASGNGEACLWEGDIVNIPLDQYLNKSRNWKHRMKLWRTGLDFSDKELPIPGYILGAWLGDGHSNRAAITTMDSEIQSEWAAWVASNGDGMSVYQSGPSNRARTYSATTGGTKKNVSSTLKLNKLGVLNSKRIPHEYLTSSRSQRLELLAGIVDTDGYYSGDAVPLYEVTQKNEALASDIAYLARSLGFRVTTNKVTKKAQTGVTGEYTKLLISGPLSTVPVRLERKKAVNGKNDPLTTNFKIDNIGEGEYYGFTLDGDHLFLLGDFTVTHNTTSLITVSAMNLLQGKDVLFVFHEGRINDIRIKFMKAMLGASYQDSLTRLGSPEERMVQQAVNEHLVVLPMVQGGLSVEEAIGSIERTQDEWFAKTGRHFDLIVDDYPGKLMTTYAKGGQLAMRHIQEIAYNRFTSLAQVSGRECHVLTAIQTNREGSKVNKGRAKDTGHRLIDTEDVAEAFGAIQTATNVLTLNRDLAAAAAGVVTWGIAKSRSSEVGHAILTRSFYHMARTHWNDPKDSTWYRGGVSLSDKVDELLTQFAGSEVKNWHSGQ